MKNVAIIIFTAICLTGCETGRLYNFHNQTESTVYLLHRNYAGDEIRTPIHNNDSFEILDIEEHTKLEKEGCIRTYEIPLENQNFFSVNIFTVEANFYLTNTNELYYKEFGDGRKISISHTDCE